MCPPWRRDDQVDAFAPDNVVLNVDRAAVAPPHDPGRKLAGLVKEDEPVVWVRMPAEPA